MRSLFLKNTYIADYKIIDEKYKTEDRTIHELRHND